MRSISIPRGFLSNTVEIDDEHMSKVVSLNGRIGWAGGNGKPELSAGHCIIAGGYKTRSPDLVTQCNACVKQAREHQYKFRVWSIPIADLRIVDFADSSFDFKGERHQQGWLTELYEDLDEVVSRAQIAVENKEAVSIGYCGNIVDLLGYLVDQDITPDLASDQTSLHNPWLGGYMPVNLSFNQGREMIIDDPEQFKIEVKKTLRKHVKHVNKLAQRGTIFWDYGNAFLLESSRAEADILELDGSFRYPSYVENIMGPMCFDYGFGPFRWVCTSGSDEDLRLTDGIAAEVLRELAQDCKSEISTQYRDNIRWIEEAENHALVVGSKARILYADEQGRLQIALAFNHAIKEGKISAPIVLGRDHHDVGGTDSPYRETANIKDGSMFTADMAIHNFVGDSFRGATWTSIHNGGGVGWGEVINGGFGMYIDGSNKSEKAIKSMVSWDVMNGLARRSWARNSGAISTVQDAVESDTNLHITIPNLVDDNILNLVIERLDDSI